MGENITEARNQIRVCLVTGYGSMGKELVDILLQRGVVVRVLDNNENSLYHLRERYSGTPKFANLRFLYGDVCDHRRMRRAVEGVDTVIHTAALKHVWLGEANPDQVDRVNVQGTQTVIDATLDEKTVDTLMFVSSDKAVNPSNLYGQSKAMAEGLVLNAYRLAGNRPTKFSVFRSGNFYCSSGSVIEKWNTQVQRGEPITLVKGNFKRYFIGTWDAAKLCIKAVEHAQGNDVFIPRMREYSMEELAKLLSGNIKWIEPGRNEKLSEELFTKEEGKRIEDLDELIRIAPVQPTQV